MNEKSKNKKTKKNQSMHCLIVDYNISLTFFLYKMLWIYKLPITYLLTLLPLFFLTVIVKSWFNKHQMMNIILIYISNFLIAINKCYWKT